MIHTSADAALLPEGYFHSLPCNINEIAWQTILEASFLTVLTYASAHHAEHLVRASLSLDGKFL